MTLSFAALLDWVEGELSAEEAERVTAALAEAGPETRETVAWLRAFQDLSEEIVLTAPPAHVRWMLRWQFRQHVESATETEHPNPTLTW